MEDKGCSILEQNYAGIRLEKVTKTTERVDQFCRITDRNSRWVFPNKIQNFIS
jgi:hypothetical protein